VIPRLVYITDGERGTGGRPLAAVIAAAARGGVEAVVLRERALDDRAFGELVAELQPLRPALRVLVSRRLDLAAGFELDGVQLAADAVAVAEARAWLGADALIGYSAHSGAEARAAAHAGASFATLSPIYPTESKPAAEAMGVRWLAKAVREAGLPVLALGGLTPGRSVETLSAGASGVAAVSAIGAVSDIEAAAREFRRAITENTT